MINSYNNITIQNNNSKWLRKRISNNLIRSSVSSIISVPNKSKLINSKSIQTTIQNNQIKKTEAFFNTNLTTFKINKDLNIKESKYYNINNKNSYLKINPKYLFSESTLKKIIKLKDIFLEFDEDGSKKLELNELATMFETNNIPVNKNELYKLFFEDDNLKNRKDIKEPFLDFYQLILFALNSKNDDKFRKFMRNIKDKLNSNKNNSMVEPPKYNNISKLKFKLPDLINSKTKSNNNSKNYNISSSSGNNFKINKRKSSMFFDDNLKSEFKNNKFLPMNFKLLLEFFNSKGKMRASEQILTDMKLLMDRFDYNKFTSENNKKFYISKVSFTNSINNKKQSLINCCKDKNSSRINFKNSLIKDSVGFNHENINLDIVVKNFQKMIYHSKIYGENCSDYGKQIKEDIKNNLLFSKNSLKKSKNNLVHINKTSVKNKDNKELIKTNNTKKDYNKSPNKGYNSQESIDSNIVLKVKSNKNSIIRVKNTNLFKKNKQANIIDKYIPKEFLLKFQNKLKNKL